MSTSRFPLSELCVAGAIVSIAAGALQWGEERGFWLICAGTALGCLGGLGVALREHLAGREDNTVLLAATSAGVVSAVILFTTGSFAVAVGPAALSFAVAFAALQRAVDR